MAFCWGPLPSKKGAVWFAYFNPDGSEAEKSGNGLRIFSRYLWDKKLVGKDEFTIETPGGVVKSTVMQRGKVVRVEMGKVSFWSDEIPVVGPRREVINEAIHLRGQKFSFCAATVGNPHCVVPVAEDQRRSCAPAWAIAGNAYAFPPNASTCSS
ncbi:MAG: hypothetical protein WDM80_04280 [Limisphaerales bacterium]